MGTEKGQRKARAGLIVPEELPGEARAGGCLPRLGGVVSTVLAIVTGYVLSIPKQALELEHARAEARARNEGTLDLTVNRVTPSNGPSETFLILATLHTKAAGGRGIEVRKIRYELYLGEACSSEFQIGASSESGAAILGQATRPLAAGPIKQQCASRDPTDSVRWIGLPGDHASDIEWREIDYYETKGMRNGAGPLEPGEASSSSMQWALEIPKGRTGLVAVSAKVEWCEESGLIRLGDPCSVDGTSLAPEDWSGKRFHWEFRSSALLSLAAPLAVAQPN